ncbi:MAG: peroxiredoxin [Cyanobacteria bacterium QH_8_48_120]|jgi:peroxiredoxin Q/BCP|nr:MAG: peroxiredoxin [Cyanobacteria bacterium QH_10_48_56]PSO56109.1 MAG: peroxiredoxin [Cyanobacteria bacterium QH_1_48_107]PSO60651.1 MAG: peroxiredoxin [Cyanobacteria bacterium QH_7_48_89]PSO68362.1 MAG: peroxiredoxin [Cyanobacteria bacterium QH_6_48_35]PSO71933.1 MAG: peroxiredoxin [Cyanobacteria bacterium QS_1_48_34]PSO75232.1 MAG: peroxiredoxin [Cyanobacteria bacterium QH_8_48_120]PSO76843.1 MAG: peroxiredoxin [Cyanobacteria bacterium QH_3_48_40]PSO82714.1 MAG: peroxiredoxin [Cyanobac
MALTVGTKAPSFSTKDDEGKTVSLSDFAGKTVVLYFYPKDDTPGCTKEAQNFRDNHTQYQDKDVVVLGVSQDDEASHKQFKQKYGLPFTLLTDVDGAITKAYDVDGGGYAKRATYIIDGDGKISHVDTNVQASSHAEDLLSTVS